MGPLPNDHEQCICLHPNARRLTDSASKPRDMVDEFVEGQVAAPFPRFITVEEAAQLLGVSEARISLWIGECKLPVAARSEYAGFLLRTMTVETVGRRLSKALPPE